MVAQRMPRGDQYSSFPSVWKVFDISSCTVVQMDINSGARRRKPGVGRQTGGIAPLLALAVPALVAAGKASAL